MKNNDTRAMQNPNGEDCTYNRPCSPHGSECASCEYAQSVTHNIAMSAEQAHKLAHDAEHLRKLMVLWPQNHIIHQLAAALRQAMESSKQTELREITKVRLEVIGYGSVPASLEEQRVMARTLLSAPAQPVIPEQRQMVPDERPADSSNVNDAEAWFDEGWNACRAEMLKAQPVSNPYKLNSWISVADRLPSEFGRYLCYVEEQNDLGKSHYQWNCSWNGDVFSDSSLTGRVTHWMPLPAAPAQENE
ncbi:DUF551 domain-containing protein [Hafnia paralvei]|uniref:DUF551 domain-containing protein n=1 Tax=Hafnia paralvei TaxID=546367 RepID=UPI0021095AA1|nr:DUF551 domain-containing protein [Hafnia paralvei]MCQ4171717.1 DUF551 domain-containing protein [Hafnia paralvei]